MVIYRSPVVYPIVTRSSGANFNLRSRKSFLHSYPVRPFTHVFIKCFLVFRQIVELWVHVLRNHVICLSSGCSSINNFPCDKVNPIYVRPLGNMSYHWYHLLLHNVWTFNDSVISNLQEWCFLLSYTPLSMKLSELNR